MLKDQRSAAEIMPIARGLGDEKKHIVNYWLDRLKDLPNGTEMLLDKRLLSATTVCCRWTSRTRKFPIWLPWKGCRWVDST